MPKRPVTRRSFIIGYFVLALGIALGFLYSNVQAHDADVELCKTQRESRVILRRALLEDADFLEPLTATSPDGQRYVALKRHQAEELGHSISCEERLGLDS